MAEDEVKTEEKSEPKEAAGTGGGMTKLVPALLLVNTLLLAGVLAMLFVKLPGRHPAGEKTAAEADHAAGAAVEAHGGKTEPGKAGAPGPTLRLPDFVVHLRDEDSERYARVSFEMEVQDEKAKEAVTARLPQIRDAFLAYLSDRTADQLRGSDAISRVKGTLTEKLAEIAPGVPVRKLFVTELIVQ